MTRRVAFYLRVSTGDGQQTIENQRRALDEIASRAGWEIVEVYSDDISGTKGPERRPAFDRMLKAADVPRVPRQRRPPRRLAVTRKPWRGQRHLSAR